MAQRDERVVGVFRDADAARDAADAAREHGADVRVGDDEDMRSALRGEMQEEGRDLIAGPGLPGFTKEMAKGVVPLSIIGAIIGALLLLPFAFMTWGTLSLGARLLWMVVAGVFFGGTVGFMVGGILGARSQNRAPAAQRGVTVSATDEPGATDDLVEQDPIRVESVADDGFPRETLATEEDLHDGLYAERAGRAWQGSDVEGEAEGEVEVEEGTQRR